MMGEMDPAMAAPQAEAAPVDPMVARRRQMLIQQLGGAQRGGAGQINWAALMPALQQMMGPGTTDPKAMQPMPAPVGTMTGAAPF